MRAHVNRQYIREVEKVFSSRYPYLRLEFPKEGVHWMAVEEDGVNAEKWRRLAEEFLIGEGHCQDATTVLELELRLTDLLNVPVVVFRQSGNYWIETTMTRNWTLKEQNDHGRELTEKIK